MICEPCRAAGALNAESVNRLPGSETERILRAAATREHSECKGGTWCDCQHFSGPGLINLDRMNK